MQITRSDVLRLMSSLIASPPVTLLNTSDAFTFSAPKILPSISENTGILDDPPVLTTASISSGSNPDAADRIHQHLFDLFAVFQDIFFELAACVQLPDIQVFLLHPGDRRSPA